MSDTRVCQLCEQRIGDDEPYFESFSPFSAIYEHRTCPAFGALTAAVSLARLGLGSRKKPQQQRDQRDQDDDQDDQQGVEHQ